MRFRLTYQGELKSAGNNSNRVKEKQHIRNALSPQLEELWQQHRSLQGNFGVFDEDDVTQYGIVRAPTPEETIDWQKKQIAKIREPIIISGRSFVPLIRRSHDACCSVDILFLRKDSPGTLIGTAGDLDNRLKLLFDGFRMPRETEIDSGRGDDVMFCLTEDDALISDFSVKTDYLLSRPHGSINDVLLIIEVNVSVTRYTNSNAFLHMSP